MLFAFLWLAFSYTHQGDKSPIAASRLAALQARWHTGSWVIDAYEKRTPDKALVNGHYYSDKAPGTLLIAAPGFYAAAGALRLAGVPVDSPTGWWLTSWATSVFGVGLLAAVGGVAFCNWLARRVSQRAAMVTTLAVFLGAAPLPYATMLFSHAAVVGLICLALWLVDGKVELRGEEWSPRWTRARREAVAGLALGLALASEYSAGLVMAGMLLSLAIGDGWQRAARIGFWMLPMLALIPAYSWACFGTPLTIGYAHNSTFAHLKRGFFGIGFPDLATAWNLLFSPARGLFYWTPFLALAALGYSRLLEVSHRWFWACYLIPMMQVAAFSGNDLEWMGGPSLGPRYLAPMLPWLALPAAFAAERWPKTALALAGISMVLTGLGTAVNASLPMKSMHPLGEEIWPGLLTGKIAWNLGQAVGLPGVASLLPGVIFSVASLGWVWRQAAAKTTRNASSFKPPAGTG